jgi:cell division protein FtsN
MQEEKELEEEILEEKKEDKEFAEAKKEMEEAIARDQSGDMANAGPSSGAFKLRFDKEILAINERVHNVSQRVEKLSERVHNLAQHLEFLPSRLAALKIAEKKVEQVLEMPKSPVKLAQDSKSPYWGVQVGAYKTKPGAKIAWSEILSNPAAIELNDAIVKYVEMTRKNGSNIYRIIVNNYASRKAASAACKSFKSNGVDCYTVHIK